MGHQLRCRSYTPIRYEREIAAARFVPMEGDNHVFPKGDTAYRTFFQEVDAFLGDSGKWWTRGRSGALRGTGEP